ncbi:DNA-directed RNA polymerase I subunit RPA43 [Emydura macquarii macquarii]|uniref:DNA-directed RNA polymerase I subunit RPA43 n=1 Tax=Emydura macquarii macquarii TaxID=1129001 RepID=UPI00352AD02C
MATAVEQPRSTAGPLPCPEVPSFAAACGLMRSRYSCLVLAPHRRHIALAPRYLNQKRTGISHQLDAELRRYSESLSGVPVAYDNVRVVGELGDIHDDQGFIHFNIEADFVIFTPKKGKKLVGVINKVAPSHIGCLIHGCFNASIPKPDQMSAIQWQDLGLKIGDKLEFEVLYLDYDAAGVFFIRGRLNKDSMQSKYPETVTENTKSRDETPKKKHKKRERRNCELENGTEDVANNADNVVEDAEEQNADTINGFYDKKRKKKKKHKEEKQEPEFHGSDSRGYPSDHKKAKKKRREHCDTGEESELSQLSQEPKPKKRKE